MKVINMFAIASLFAVSALASADEIANSSSTSTAGSASLSQQEQGQSQGQGQTAANAFKQKFDNHSVNQAPDLGNAVGIATAPALTTTLTETCMGSTSLGAGFSGGSFSFGTTWRDHACVRRLDARQIQSMGDVQAAKEIMCDSDLVREAFKRVGRPCAEDGGSYVAVSQPAPVAEEVPVQAPKAAAEEVTDDQDWQAQDVARKIKIAAEARAAMRAKGY